MVRILHMNFSNAIYFFAILTCARRITKNTRINYRQLMQNVIIFHYMHIIDHKPMIIKAKNKT